MTNTSSVHFSRYKSWQWHQLLISNFVVLLKLVIRLCSWFKNLQFLHHGKVDSPPMVITINIFEETADLTDCLQHGAVPQRESTSAVIWKVDVFQVKGWIINFCLLWNTLYSSDCPALSVYNALVMFYIQGSHCSVLNDSVNIRWVFFEREVGKEVSQTGCWYKFHLIRYLHSRGLYGS